MKGFFDCIDWSNKHDRKFALSILLIGIVFPILATGVTNVLLLRVTNNIYISAVFALAAFAIWVHLAAKILATMFLHFADKHSSEEEENN